MRPAAIWSFTATASWRRWRASPRAPRGSTGKSLERAERALTLHSGPRRRRDEADDPRRIRHLFRRGRPETRRNREHAGRRKTVASIGQQGREGRTDGPPVGRERRVARLTERSVAGRRCRRLRRSARPAAASRPQPEGRSGAHLDPGAGRAISRLRRDARGALRLELAADYLVMAAWLAYLKSKLLIPKQPGDDGESGEEMAAVLPFRLKRLEAMRDAAARLVNRNRLGRDVFARGMPELVIVEKRNEYSRLALRSAVRLCRAASAQGHHQCPHRQARRLVAGGSARHPDAAGRQLQRLDRARSFLIAVSCRARKSGRR